MIDRNIGNPDPWKACDELYAEVKRLRARNAVLEQGDPLRLVYTEAPGIAMPELQGKVFALIGPFESFQDKEGFQDALELLVRGWNFTNHAAP